MSFKLYQLMHIKETAFGTDKKQIGVFSSLERAIDEKQKREDRVGFKQYPKGFIICVFLLDHDRCQEIIYL